MNNTLHIDVDAHKLRARFDAYWDAVKDILSQDLISKATKGGFRNVTKNRVVKAAGGEYIFYRNQIIEEVKEWCSANSKSVLSFGDVSIKYTSADVTSISADVHYEPEVKWSVSDDAIPGINAPMSVEIDAKMSVKDLIDSVTKNEIAALLDKHSTTTQINAPISIGSVAILDIESKIDGEIDPSRTGTNVTWLVSGDQFKEPQIADNLVGLAAGDTKEFSITFNNTSGLIGKTVDIKVKVNDVLCRNMPTFDEVAKIYNKTAEDMMSLIESTVTKQVNDTRNEAIIAKAYKQLSQLCSIECNPPDEWLDSRAQLVFRQNLSKFKSEYELIEAFGAIMPLNKSEATKHDVINYISGQILTSFCVDLTFKSWGLKAGIKLEDGSFVSSDKIAEYADVVKANILKTAAVKENILK